MTSSPRLKDIHLCRKWRLPFIRMPWIQQIRVIWQIQKTSSCRAWSAPAKSMVIPSLCTEEMYADHEESLKAAVEEALVQELVVEALAEQENITVSKSELEEYKESIVALYDYADVKALEEEYTDEILVDSLLNEKVQDYLLSQAKITYVTEEEYYGYEEWSDEDYVDDLADEEIPEDEE